MAKEIAYFNRNTNKSHVFLLKPPYKLDQMSQQERKRIFQSTNFHHGLHFNEGLVELADVVPILGNLISRDLVVMKGAQKVKWLKENIPMTKFKYDLVDLEQPSNIFNVEVESIKKLQKRNGHLSSYNSCIFHDFNGKVCALRNTFLINNEIFSNEKNKEEVKINHVSS